MVSTSSQAHWHCLLPGLCGPFPKDTPRPDSPVLQQLAGVLGDAEVQDAAAGFYAQLAVLSGWPQPLPVAALHLRASTRRYAQQHCMQLSPVHLHADMDHAILYDDHALQLHDEHRRTLRDELNAHFAQDGIEIVDDAHGRWFIVSQQAFGIDTTALHQVIGRNVNFFLPQGEQAVQWKRFMNEAQMLLHMSAVNTVREQRGELPVNSLWLWGQGALPQSLPTQTWRWLSDDDVLAGMARCYQHDCLPLAQHEQLANQTALLCDSRLLSSASYGDVGRWLEQLQTLLDEWLLPLIARARRRRVILTIYPCHGRVYRLHPRGGWQSVRSLFRQRLSPEEVFCRER